MVRGGDIVSLLAFVFYVAEDTVDIVIDHCVCFITFIFSPTAMLSDCICPSTLHGFCSFTQHDNAMRNPQTTEV